MEVQERIKQYLEGGKTRAEAISLAYSDHYREIQKLQQGGTQEKPQYQQGGSIEVKYTQNELDFLK